MGKLKRIALTEEDIRPYLTKRMNLDDAAKDLGVSLSTLKRRLKDHGMRWSRSNKSLKHKSASAPASEYSQPNLADFTNGAHDEQAQEYFVDANQPMLSPTPIRCNGSSNSSPIGTMAIVDGDRNSSTYYAVKATYKNDTVKINFPCLFTFDLLKEEVGRKLNLELDSFKMKYLDKENDLVLVTDDADLQLALDEFRSNTVRLMVSDV